MFNNDQITPHIVCRYGEINLKGNNRHFFITKLANNIRQCLQNEHLLFDKISTSRGRVLISVNNILTYTDFKQYAQLKLVFGIQDIGFSYKVAKDIDAVKKALDDVIPSLPFFDSFRITTKRQDKTFSYNSMEMDKEIGAYIAVTHQKTVALKNPEYNIELEVTDKGIFIIPERVMGFSGFPTTSQGEVFVLIENIQSIVAALLVMKTGCSIILLIKKQSSAIMQTKQFVLLEKYAYGFKLKPIIITDEDDIAQQAKQHQISVLVTGQTIAELKLIPSLTNLQPLITYTPEQIKQTMEAFEHASVY